MSEQNNTLAAEENKTFTQEDVNRIVQERLAKERSKGDATFTRREQELAQREMLLTAKEKLAAKGLPLELLDVLNTSSSEALEKGILALEKLQIAPTPTSTSAKVSTGGQHSPDDIDITGDSIRAAMGLQIK